MNLTESDGQEQRGWRRVSRANPCLVCGQPDWCLVTLGGSAAICARVSDGAVKQVGQAGWLHRLQQDGRGRPEGHGRGTIRLVPSVPLEGRADLAEPTRTSPAPRPTSPRLAEGLGLVTAADIEPLWRLADLVRVLNRSRRVLEQMRSAGRLPQPDLVVGNRSPRWKAETIRTWIEDGGGR